MSFVTQFFIKPAKPSLLRPPSGSFTISANGTVMTSTLPRSFPVTDVRRVGEMVLIAFRSAEGAGIKLNELCFQYPKLKLVAREARGGAIVFLHPE
jgi:hypothetical protein